MKTKLCRPVLIETKNPSQLYLHETKGLVKLAPVEHEPGMYGGSNQQLILISLDPDEKIEENDLYIHFNSNTNEYSLFKADEKFDDGNNPNIIDRREFVYHYWNKKVIATQSQLSPEYIQQFIEQYNTGKVEDIEIKMELFWNNGGKFGIQPFPNEIATEKDRVYLPKLTNSFVTIVKKEDIYGGWANLSKEALEVILPKDITKKSVLYTEEEVLVLLSKLGIHATCTHCDEPYDWDITNPDNLLTEWFNENKKK